VSNRVNLSIAVALLLGSIAWLVGAMNIRHMLRSDRIGEAGLAVFLGVLVAILSVSLIVRYLPLARAERATATGAINEPGDEEPDLPASSLRPLLFMAACGLWTVLLAPLGFLIATPPFIAAQLWMLGYRHPLRAAAIAVFSAVAMWLVFDFVLGVNLPAGLHGPVTNRLRL
jgi:hypothetical protein